MKTTKTILIILIFGISFLSASGQERQEKKSKWAYKKVNENGSYVKMVSDGFQYTTFNFFTGPDVENFRTTLKGFGSIGNDFELTLITVGNRQVDAFLDLGLSLRYYRFEENLKLSKSAGSMEASIVENPPYEFKNKFFSWSKNKMVIGYLIVPFGFDLKFRYADIRLQASYMRYLSGKHKLKYIDDKDAFENRGDITLGWLAGDNREKYKIPNSEFKNYYLNKNNITLGFTLAPKIIGLKLFSIGYRYDLKPLFLEGKGPDVHESAIILSFDLDD